MYFILPVFDGVGLGVRLRGYLETARRDHTTECLAIIVVGRKVLGLGAREGKMAGPVFSRSESDDPLKLNNGSGGAVETT